MTKSSIPLEVAMSNRRKIRLHCARILASLALYATSVAPALSAVSNLPLFLVAGVEPNIVVTLDDSGSMQWAYVPDNLDAYASTRRFKSATFNPLYYDPNKTYSPAVDASGNLQSTGFTSARINGFDSTRGTVNLSTSYRPTLSYNPSSTSQSFASNPAADFPGKTSSGVAAYYYVFDAALANCDGTTNDDDCYKLVTVSSTSGPNGTDERQNFANWYSFYRTRNLMTATAATLAFKNIGDDVRLAWQNLHTCANNFSGSSCTGWSSASYDNRIRKFGGSHRTNFYNWLFRLPASGGTPLRTALQRAGNYYTTSANADSPGVGSPYAYDPQVTEKPVRSCRPNFLVLMTDGIWNSDTITSFGNADNTGKTLPDAKVYTPQAPYKDNNSNSLADMAFYYWSTDLYPALSNSLQAYLADNTGTETQKYWNPKNDPATWQHMVTFTIGLGLTTSLTNPDWGGNTYAGDYEALRAGTKSWPATGSDVSPGNAYDLWHAAINSRGQFFSAEDSSQIYQAFQTILDRVNKTTGSASAISANSQRVDTNTLIYQASFESATWSGELTAYKLEIDGSIGNKQWAASESLPGHNARNIYTWTNSTTKGQEFKLANLTATQKGYLGTDDTERQKVIDYIRGDQSNEAKKGGTYRDRTSVLGDIVNSDPAFVKSLDFGYVSLPIGTLGQDTYAAFRDANKDRTAMLYVGANDGMLHALDAQTGVEKFAYIPDSVIPKLKNLTDPAYVHSYYVDGPVAVGDAYITTQAGSGWRTVLVGTAGAGAKSVFALDITNPDTFSNKNIMWEISSATDSDLGYVLGQPVIARMQDGTWVAVFGNGYESANNRAVLFIVDLQTGAILRKIDTKVGSSTTANGLAAPALLADPNRTITTVYAGDKLGNLWKFDVSGTTPSQWTSAFKSGANPAPLFTAKDNLGAAQPISSGLELFSHQDGGVVVLFGTGKYFETNDNLNTQRQTFYGIWDKPDGNAITYSNRDDVLQKQDILIETNKFGQELRGVTQNGVDWSTKRGWYIELLSPSATSNTGERVVTEPIIRYDRVVFVSVIPSSDPCQYGGESWLMEVDALTGGRYKDVVLDINKDSQFNTTDTISWNSTDIPVSGIKSGSGVGMFDKPAVVKAGSKEYKIMSGTTGKIQVAVEAGSGSSPRTSWKQLQ